MTADEYNEVAAELRSLLRVYPIDDERVSRLLKEALEVCTVRERDARKESVH